MKGSETILVATPEDKKEKKHLYVLDGGV